MPLSPYIVVDIFEYSCVRINCVHMCEREIKIHIYETPKNPCNNYL